MQYLQIKLLFLGKSINICKNNLKMQPQIRLFDLIKNTLKPEVSLVDEVAQVLSMSTDSVYRRIRGETALTFDEAHALAQHFGISLDEIVEAIRLQTLNFHFQKFDRSDFMAYLSFIYNEFKSMSNFEERKMILTAKDIPSFYFFLFPELLVFKAYFYARILWASEEETEVLSFDYTTIYRMLRAMNQELQKMGQKILEAYVHLPSIEIWNNNTLDGHLHHIKYSWDSGFFKNKENALMVLGKTEELVAHLKKQAILGGKLMSTQESTNRNNFELYYSEGMQLENTILISWSDKQKTYMIYNTGDYLMTTNEPFCKRVESYIHNMIKRSSLISKIGEKERNRLFRNIQEKLQRLRQYIEFS